MNSEYNLEYNLIEDITRLLTVKNSSASLIELKSNLTFPTGELVPVDFQLHPTYC